MLFKIREWNNLPEKFKTFFSNKRIRDLYPSIDDWSWLPVVGLIHDLGKVMKGPNYSPPNLKKFI